LANNESLSVLERNFLTTLNEIARKINTYITYFNIILVVSLFVGIQFLVSTALVKLKLRNTRLRQLNEELDTLIYSVSHDLKSPMASVQGLIHLSLKESNISQINDYLSKMSLTLEKQNRFIQKIIQTKKNQISNVRQEATNFPELVEQSIQQLMYMKEASGISFSKDIDVDVIKTDELLLEAVINNLIGNSIQYHDKSKPTRFIAIKARNHAKRLTIEISDNGIGIDAHDQQFIFNKFYSSKGARKTSGLGLSIVKENVEKLQGTIELSSQKGVGTSFKISIPVG
jgi:signal transduction histidine kinase